MAIINHGTVRGYKLGCRCEECTAANTLAKGRERDRKREREGLPPVRKPARTHRPETEPIEDAPGPIEEATRAALADAGGDSAIAKMRREVCYRAAANMDNPKFAPYLFRNADVLRVTVADLLAESPVKDGEADALAGLMATIGGSRRSGPARGSTAAVDDAAKPGKGDGS